MARGIDLVIVNQSWLMLQVLVAGDQDTVNLLVLVVPQDE
jgi:hypothetical protein